MFPAKGKADAVITELGRCLNQPFNQKPERPRACHRIALEETEVDDQRFPEVVGSLGRELEGQVVVSPLGTLHPVENTGAARVNGT